VSGVHYATFSFVTMTPIITGRGGQLAKPLISQTVGLPRSIAVSERKTRMIAYTAWDSLQAIAQQYDADLVMAPGEPIELSSRRTHSAPRVSMFRLGERLRAGLALPRVHEQAPLGRRVSEKPIA